MLSVFAVPKPFSGHVGTIQLNAIRSWRALALDADVILLGDEPGAAEAAATTGAHHVREVARNEHGTPLLDDVFRRAREAARHDVLCYVNADILLTSDLPQAVAAVRAARARFLLVGRRTNLDVTEPLDFSGTWEDDLRRRAAKEGELTPPEWIDYFVFPARLFHDVLPFAIGRAGFDNWLLWKAKSEDAAVVDATRSVLVVHQNHDYGHHPGGRQGVWDGIEAQRNRELVGGSERCLFISDATHLLVRGRLVPNLSPRRARLWAAQSRALRPLVLAKRRALDATLPVRARLGLRRSSIARLARRTRGRLARLRA
jgi:hypothetical protein